MAPKVKYKINLNEVFSRAYSGVDIETRTQLRPLLSDPEVKRTYGLKVKERIEKNTLDSKDRFGKNFPAYSSAYKESDIFKIFGKTSKVNMKLSGEMLASMRQIPGARQTVTLDFISKENNDKAHGHINGANVGRGVRGPHLKVRNFFGLPKDEEEELLKETIEDQGSGRLVSLLSEAIAELLIPVNLPGQEVAVTTQSSLIEELFFGT